VWCTTDDAISENSTHHEGEAKDKVV
jgi:hypothetical protein